MKQLSYGNKGQVSFDTWDEYYYALGFLANRRNAELRWEHNEDQGAWGSEGRIHCLIPQTYFPQYFLFTAGRGNVCARINCNDYVATLVMEHHFATGRQFQDLDAIRSTIPTQYLPVFEDGYDGRNPPTRRSDTSRNNSVGYSIPTRRLVTRKPAATPKATGNSKYAGKGDRVRHVTHGVGTVINVAGDKITIRFDSGVKEYKIGFAFDNGYLTKL